MTDTTRRTFLTAGAAAAVPFFIKADDKTGSKNPILGSGDQQYECIHDWGNLPSNIKYGNTHSVCEDAQGHIYIHHTVYKDSPSPDSVVVFDEKGKFVRSFGAMFRGGAHGMHLRKEGNTEYLYFCDEKHGIITKRTMKGEEVWTMGYPQDSPVYQKGPGASGPGGAAGLNYRPTNIAIAPNGDFWVGDGYGSYYMFHYSQQGNSYPKLVKTFGGPPAGQAPAGAGAGAGRGAGGGGGRGAGAAAAPAVSVPATAARAPGDATPPPPPPPAQQVQGPAAAAVGAPAAGAAGAGAPAGGGRGAGGGAGRGAGGGGGRGPSNAPIDSMNNPHGNMVDLRDPANPILLVADRGNRRIVRYTLDDKPIDIVEGTTQPCHFHERKGLVVVPDLSGPVHVLDQKNKVLVSMGQGPGNPPRTTDDRSKFIPGQFVNPHGAIFDHNGNIFVVEWVEIGRVTKLRKV